MSTKTTQSTSVCWQWQDNDGAWNNYDQIHSDTIEKLSNGSTVTLQLRSNFVYDITKTDDNTGSQKNTKTNMVRSVRRIKDFIWQWQDNDGVWIDYDIDTNNTIESLSHKGKHSIKNGRWQYEIEKIDDNNGLQINTSTKKKRQLRRINPNQSLYSSVWQVLVDNGKWSIIDDTGINKQIDDLKINTKSQYQINNNSYEVTKISNQTAAQVNTGSKKIRNLRKIMINNSNSQRIIWQYENDNNGYSNCDIDMIQTLCNLKVNDKMQYQRSNISYTLQKINDDKVTQTNTQSKKQRQIYQVTDDITTMHLDDTFVFDDGDDDSDDKDNTDNKDDINVQNNSKSKKKLFKFKNSKQTLSFIGAKSIFDNLWNDNQYKPIIDSFYKTMDSKQNPIVFLFQIESETCGLQAFQSLSDIKKKSFGQNVERRLFHGTKENVVQTIISNGFNRDFNKVSYYGKGVYFASDSSISKDYCDVSKDGYSFMFVCRVIVGDYCLGDSSMMSPPMKPDGKSQYDCLVNNTYSPTIFVIARDYHSVPEFLIVFRNK